MKIAIAGSGKMGTDIFHLVSGAGLEVLWLCVDEPEAERARLLFEKRLARQLRAGLIDRPQYDRLLDSTTISNDAAHASDVDLVIEAIWENLPAKQKLFEVLGSVCKRDCVFTSNTSSIPIERIFTDPDRKSFCCGMHFFYPVALKDLVEVNVEEGFSEAGWGVIQTFLGAVGRNFILLKTQDHFLMNRVLLPLQREVVSLLNEGVADPRGLDAVVRQEFLPIGMFEFFDHVGIDILHASVLNYAEGPDADQDLSLLLRHLQTRLSQGFLGLKGNKGYFDYPVHPAFFETDGMIPKERELIRSRCGKALFTAIAGILEKGILSRGTLDRALMEYWSLDHSLLEKGRALGFLA